MIMGELTAELRDNGYEPTSRESPFDDEGELWTNSYELVCDQTGIVIRKDGTSSDSTDDADETHNYRHTGNVKLYGGYTRTYFDGDGIYGNSD
jgi:hypothetical protein